MKNKIKGCFVECGVFKGGSMMAVAYTLMEEGVQDKDLYLFDTFAGMPEPQEMDTNLAGHKALDQFSKMKISDNSSTWTNSPLEEVKKAMALTGYPMDKIHFVEGLVETTIPDQIPESVAFLRLDTDWYRSTKHELIHLYPRVMPQGVIILDDYGHYVGARQAVDEYFSENNIMPFLQRIDYTGRLIIKS